MRGGYTTSEMVAHRNRCRAAHIAVDDASLLQYTVSAALPARFTEYLAIYAYRTIRYDTRCYFDVRSKADMNRLNLPHGDDN